MSATATRRSIFLDAFSPDYRRHFGLFQPRERVVEPLSGEPQAHFEWLTDVLYTATVITEHAVFVPGAFVLQCPLLSRLVEQNRLLIRDSVLRMPVGDADIEQDLERMRATYPRDEFPRMHSNDAESTVATVSEAAILRESQLTTGIMRIIQTLPDTHANGERWWRGVSAADASKVVESVERTFARGAPLTFAAVRETDPQMPPAVRRAVFGGIHYAFGSQHVAEYGLALLVDIPGIHDHFGIPATCPSYSYRRTWRLFSHCGLDRGLLRCAGAAGIVKLRSKPGVSSLLSRFAKGLENGSPIARQRLPQFSARSRTTISRLGRAQTEVLFKKWPSPEEQQLQAIRLIDELSDAWTHLVNAGDLSQRRPRPRASKSAAKSSGMGRRTPHALPRVAVITVIGPELDAMKKALGVSETARVPGGGHLRYELDLDTTFSGSIRVELHCIGAPGNIASAIATMNAQQRDPKFMLLCGIAAGRRDKVRIGDVIGPRVIVDSTLKVAEDGGFSPRPLIAGVLTGVAQMNAAAMIPAADWADLFKDVFPDTIVPPPGQEEEFKIHVARIPMLHDAALYSDNLLIRDPAVLDGATTLHQQIRAGEMEAAGFVAACSSRYPPVPWFILRGISDFGDTFKKDDFHRLASSAVASYAALYLRHILDLRIWTSP